MDHGPMDWMRISQAKGEFTRDSTDISRACWQLAHPANLFNGLSPSLSSIQPGSPQNYHSTPSILANYKHGTDSQISHTL